MSERPTRIPAVPAPTESNLLDVARAVKGVIDVREGRVGDPKDAFVKIRDLDDALFRSRYGVGGIGSGDMVIGPPGPVGPPGSLPPPDLTPPPAPTGLTAESTLTSIILQWDSPPIGYAPNHAYTEVHRADTDVIGAAVLIGTSNTQFYTDAAVELTTGYYYWIRFVSRADVEGPFNATSGTYAETAPDPGRLLDLLSGEIRDSHLYSALGAPIRQIGLLSEQAAADTITGALALHNESLARARAELSESTQRATDLLAEAQARGTAITEVRQLVDEGDAQLAAEITTLTAAVESNQAAALAAVEAEEVARANGDLAEAAQRLTLAAQMRGVYDGTDVNLVTTGLIFSERQARATADSAQAVRIDALESSVNTPSTGLLARASALETVTTNATSGNAALASRTSLLESSVSAPGTGLLSRATALETTVTNATSGNAALASRTTSLESTVNNATTGVAATATALDVVETLVNSGTQGNVALAARTSGLEASVNTPSAGNNPTYARLLTEESVRAALDGSVAALYTLRAEVSSGGRTVVGGFGLSATATATAGPRIDFGVRADRFWVGATSASSGIADVLPFVIQTAPTTINGEDVTAGVYMDTAFIKNGTIGEAKIGSLTASKITAGYTASVDIEAGTFAGSEFYIGGTITYEFGNPLRPTQRTGIAGVSAPNVALNSDGATFNVNFFRILNGGVPYVPFEIVGGLVRIKNAAINNAAIGSAQIADTIQSFSYGSTTGWRINKSGTVFFNEANIRGAINGGGFTGYAWPVAGQTGFHLGPSGLLLGNFNESKYFQVEAGGNVYAPGFSIVNGNAVFSGTLAGASGTFSGSLTAAVVQTSSIVGAAITSGYSASSAGFTASVTVNVPVGASSIIVVAYLGQPFVAFTGGGKDGFSYTDIPGGTLSVAGSPVATQTGTLIWSTGSPGAGTYSISVERDVASGLLNLGVLVTKR